MNKWLLAYTPVWECLGFGILGMKLEFFLTSVIHYSHRIFCQCITFSLAKSSGTGRANTSYECIVSVRLVLCCVIKDFPHITTNTRGAFCTYFVVSNQRHYMPYLTLLCFRLQQHYTTNLHKNQIKNKNLAIKVFTMVSQKGFEPLTPGLEGLCSIQLSY